MANKKTEVEIEHIGKVGKRITKFMKERNASRSEVAEWLQLKPRAVGEIERGSSRVTTYTIDLLCKKFRCQPNELLGYGDKKQFKDFEELFLSLTDEEQEHILWLMKRIKDAPTGADSAQT